MPYSGRSKKRFYKKSKTVPRAVKTYVTKTLDKQTEDKVMYYTLQGLYTTIPNTWTERSLCTPVVGTSGGDRIGRRIKIKSIQIKGVLTGGQDELLTDDSYNVVRLVLATFNYPSGTTPLATYAATIDQPLIKNINLAALRRVYFDKYIPLSCTSTEKGGGDGYTPMPKLVKYYKKFNNLYVTFGDDTVASPDKRLFLSAISDSAAVTHPGFVNGFILIKYEDA